MYFAADSCIYYGMGMRAQRERAEFAGYGWAALTFLLGMLALGMVFGSGVWNFSRLVGLAVVSAGTYYSWLRYERALHRKGRHTA